MKQKYFYFQNLFSPFINQISQGIDFYANEDSQGYRAVYNVLPQAQNNLTQTIAPGIFYTPTKQIDNILQVSYPPVICQKCGAILNSMNQVDYNQKVYQCVFCGQQQRLPATYMQISDQHKPAELHYAYRTMEYVISNSQLQKAQRAIIFVVDIQLPQEELDQMKEQLQLAIDLLSDDINVGLVTFGTTVNIHQLKYKYCQRKIVFRGLNDYTPEQINQSINGKLDLFVPKLSDCRENLVQIIEDIYVDQWTIEQKTRGYRATGCAIAVATSLASALQSPVAQHKNDVVNLTVLTGGPCTAGPGKIVDTQISDYIRCWPDIQENNQQARHVKDSIRFYDSISQRAQQHNIAINVFSCSTDQIGLFEMNEICKKTAGQMMISETFKYISFQKSWRIYLDSLSGRQEDTPICSSGAMQITVHTSKNWGIQQMYSQGQNVNKQQKESQQHQIFSFAQADSDFTPLFIFSLQDQNNLTTQPRFVQFCTEYTDYKTGNRILRVSTQGFQTAQNQQQVIGYFDQEAAACEIARITSFKYLQNYLQDAVKFIDRIIIKAARDFVIGNPQNEDAVKFQQQFEFFPQFLYHYRRSEFLNLFGQSPDQTIMKHYQLQRQTVQNMLSMIQPALIAYDVQNIEGEPTTLDATQCKDNRVLLFDSFFNLLVWTGKNVVAWREAGLQNKPEYANVKALLEAPKPECDEILASRFPTPRYDWCDQGSSQARFLLARVNPSQTKKNTGLANVEGEVIATDDVSLEQFLQVLKRTVIMADK